MCVCEIISEYKFGNMYIMHIYIYHIYRVDSFVSSSPDLVQRGGPIGGAPSTISKLSSFDNTILHIPSGYLT